MAQKKFNIGKKTKQAPEMNNSAGLLDLLTNDEEEEQDESQDLDTNKEEQAEEDQVVNDNIAPAVAKRTTSKSKASPDTKKEKPKAKKDLDKKLGFSTIIKSSILDEMKTVLDEYRQSVNYKYNLVQLIEDAVLAQLAKLKREMKSK